MSTPVITRFAPSPTGFLHIGGARTALFNWLYARRHGGKMLLRIEDTDRERSTKEAVDAIIQGLDWLGLAHDGDVISQYSRVARHREVAEQLVKSGKAYYCYASPEELASMREQAIAEGRPPRYDGRWRDRAPAAAQKNIQPTIRIKAPLDGETIVRDRVQGTIRFPNKDLDDFIILRSNGTPTYMHAVVVDDHDMGITHIIRGDDHLTNAARQTLIFQAMGWPVPTMAHIPLIHGADGAKLSKRHGALGIDAYRAMGYLPQALRNYLVRLGWSHQNDEIISDEDMIAWFDIENINKSAARFDFKKLEAVNGHYIRTSDNQTLFHTLIKTLPYLEGGNAILNQTDNAKYDQLLAAMPALKDRSKTLTDLLKGAQFIFTTSPIMIEEKAAIHLDENGRALLRDLLPLLKAQKSWELDTLKAVIHQFGEEHGYKLGQLAQPLRAALTGCATSPSVFEVLTILGRTQSLARLEAQTTQTNTGKEGTN
ncbi:glutamate--tRNA ligase [Bartonella sp. DGB2]|uniref:glutamate--tRNA ligase n=1 Tax=Bartonella sp. DGB2 TaxID=3388426 RepID=UPI00398FD219